MLYATHTHRDAVEIGVVGQRVVLVQYFASESAGYTEGRIVLVVGDTGSREELIDVIYCWDHSGEVWCSTREELSGVLKYLGDESMRERRRDGRARYKRERERRGSIESGGSELLQHFVGVDLYIVYIGACVRL